MLEYTEFRRVSENFRTGKGPDQRIPSISIRTIHKYERVYKILKQSAYQGRTGGTTASEYTVFTEIPSLDSVKVLFTTYYTT